MEHLCWYYILFALSLGWFLFRGLLSLIVGEVEADFDLDGDIDSDLSGLFSFKGLLHFCIGFSSYLSVVSFVETKSLYILYNFTILQYVWAVLVGLGVTLLLFYLYKFTLKADHYNNEQINFDGMKGTIIVNEGNGVFQVNVSTYLGVRKVTVKQKEIVDTKEMDWEEARKHLYACGDVVTISYDKETNTYYI